MNGGYPMGEKFACWMHEMAPNVQRRMIYVNGRREVREVDGEYSCAGVVF